MEMGGENACGRRVAMCKKCGWRRRRRYFAPRMAAADGAATGIARDWPSYEWPYQTVIKEPMKSTERSQGWLTNIRNYYCNKTKSYYCKKPLHYYCNKIFFITVITHAKSDPLISVRDTLLTVINLMELANVFLQ